MPHTLVFMRNTLADKTPLEMIKPRSKKKNIQRRKNKTKDLTKNDRHNYVRLGNEFDLSGVKPKKLETLFLRSKINP